MTEPEDFLKNKIAFPATITIARRKYWTKKGKRRTGEHWYITIPTSVRKVIDRNKTMNVTLEKII